MKQHFIYKIGIIIVLLLWLSILLMEILTNRSIEEIEESNIPLTEVFFAQKRIIKENVSADTIVDIPFKLFNTGLNDLRIKYVNPDCTCTSFNIQDSIIAPGDSSVIEISIDTRNKQGTSVVNVVVALNTLTELYKLSAVLNVNE